jgi:hypothetical protein
MERIRAIFTPKWILGLSAAVLLGFGLGSWLSPLQARSPVDPKLREQVLQILRENPDAILESVRAYQQQQQDQQNKARQSFLQSMKANPSQTIGQSPRKGAKEAKVVLVEFSDFQCPYCAKAQDTLKQFMAKHQDKVTLVYKHLPLTSFILMLCPPPKPPGPLDSRISFGNSTMVYLPSRSSLVSRCIRNCQKKKPNMTAVSATVPTKQSTKQIARITHKHCLIRAKAMVRRPKTPCQLGGATK